MLAQFSNIEILSYALPPSLPRLPRVIPTLCFLGCSGVWNFGSCMKVGGPRRAGTVGEAVGSGAEVAAILSTPLWV